MHSGPNLFCAEALNVKDLLLEQYQLVLEAGPLRLEGLLPLRDEQGVVLDTYHIRIIPTADYPTKFPLVYELDGRLPVNIDWHLFPDGHFCIKAIPEELFICSQHLTLTGFIQNQVVPFLFNQKHREEYGYFVSERSHGTAGNLEFFADIFNTRDLDKIYKCLHFISKGEKPNRVASCFCGSGLKYRKCHREAYQKLSLLPDEVLAVYRRMVAAALK